MNTDLNKNDKLKRSRRRLHIEYLIDLIGYEPAIRFCMEYAGCQLDAGTTHRRCHSLD